MGSVLVDEGEKGGHGCTLCSSNTKCQYDILAMLSILGEQERPHWLWLGINYT